MTKKSHTELYPGETNSLMLRGRMLQDLRVLIFDEVQRLEKLRANPTFPTAHYAPIIWAIRQDARAILDCLEVKL